MNSTTHLFSALPVDAASPPAEIHLLPSGQFSGADGRGPYVLENAQAVIMASMADGKLPLDENHATDLAAPRGEPAPARGWIVSMTSRPDGIWGAVEWTGSGAALMADRAYRGISPAIEHNKDGQVMRILRASLVNTPNLPLKTLHNQEHEMDLASKLRDALGLAKEADDIAIVNSVTSLKTSPSLHSAVAAAAGLQIEKLSSAEAETKIVETVKALHQQAQAAQAAAAEKADLITKVQTLETSLHALENKSKRAAAEQVVDKAITEGKPVRQLRDHYVTRHMADAKAVEDELKALPSLHAGGFAAGSITDPDVHNTDPADLARRATLHAKEHGMTHAEAVLALARKA